jgi:Flp pilus assembly protein TadD
MKCVIPLMLECMLAAEYDEARTALNPDRLEENFGKAIEHNIKRRLGLPSSTEDTAEPEKPSKCSLQ